MADSNDIKEFLTRKEVEKSLKISRSQIYNLIKSGKLPAYKVGGNLRFQKDDVNNLIKPHSYAPRKVSIAKRLFGIPKKKKRLSDIKDNLRDKHSEAEEFFEKALRLSENLQLSIDNKEKKYRIGDFLVLDYQDFANKNPHIAAAKLKRHFKEVLSSKFFLPSEKAEEILNLTESKFKDFGRRIFIQSMQAVK